MFRGFFGWISIPPRVDRLRDFGGSRAILPFFDGFAHVAFPDGALLHDVTVVQGAPFDAHGHGALGFVGDAAAAGTGAVGRDCCFPADALEGFGGAGAVGCGGVLAVEGRVVLVVGDAGGVVEAVFGGGAVGGWEGAEGGCV